MSLNDQPTLQGSAAAWRRRAFPSSTIALIGDSITAMGHSASGVTTGTYSRGYWTFASQRLNGVLKLVSRPGTLNGGVSGETTAQILVRVQQDAVALNPGWVHVLAGTNDMRQGIPFATTTANLTAIYDAVQGAGIGLVVGTIPPMDTATTAQFAAIELINTWVREQGRTRSGVILADYHAKLTGPSGAYRVTGTTAYTGDDVHPSTGGALRMGKVLADALAPAVRAGSVLPTSNVDAYPNRASLSTPNLITNPVMTGTTGNANGSPLTNLADSWVITTYDGSATSGLTGVTASKVTPRSDDTVGEWQQFAFTAANPLRFQQTISAAPDTIQPGDTIWGQVEYTLSNVTALNLLRAQIIGFDANAGYATRAVGIDPNWEPADTSTIPYSYLPASGVLTTPAIVAPSTSTTGWTFAIDASLVGTLQIGRVAWRRKR